MTVTIEELLKRNGIRRTLDRVAAKQSVRIRHVRPSGLSELRQKEEHYREQMGKVLAILEKALEQELLGVLKRARLRNSDDLDPLRRGLDIIGDDFHENLGAKSEGRQDSGQAPNQAPDSLVL